MVKRIQIDMPNKLFYAFVVVGLTILSVAVVYGYGTSNPVAFGHSIGEIAPPVGCLSGQVLGWDGSGWQCVNAAEGGEIFDLIYGMHSSGQCTSLGGAVIDAGAGDICKFAGSSCRAGWTQYGSWSTTSSNTATCNPCREVVLDENPACSCNTWTPPITCDSGSHTFSNVAKETCTTAYYHNYCDATCTTHTVTTSASITEVGCY